jgi:GT2 family glycosyltransferase
MSKKGSLVLGQKTVGDDNGAFRDRLEAAGRDRVRVDGKFFARGPKRLRARGVSYGPFTPNEDGEPFPALARVKEDFALMKAAGINAVRTYHNPPDWLLREFEEQGLVVWADIPWSKHLCFLDSVRAQREAREAVRQAAWRGRNHPCVLAYSIGNEIPPDIIRWHGTRRVERFLAELADVVKQTDPHALATYANYPPTEYLDLAFLDFQTFNVYLHDCETFRRYLLRLQNFAGNRPLVLGELGMDTLRNGELDQCQFLAGHVREALLVGLAGIFVFSWTDEWYTGGYPVKDWAFGITRENRSPKASYHALRETFEATPAEMLPERPRVSVIVCTYNGGGRLEECLRSLSALDYPNYEIIVVDDGSTDATRAILKRFPRIRTVHQDNRGLSSARNAGLYTATGAIVAYTDDDCVADPDWLTHLVHQFLSTDAAAVGGPNLTPEDGWLAACVAAAPGQPTHVLESPQVAEHIPGCNMAFRREVLLAINGFDPLYRKAGDDVDICWRLQQAGHWITFAPAAFVWHHRRQNPRRYLRQQAGYGEAEGLLQFKHPEKFNGRGDGKWRGVLYGASATGLRFGGPMIYRGTFGTALFQCVYQPVPVHWAMLPSTLEWHLGVGLLALVALVWWPAWVAVAVMVGLSAAVAALQAARAVLPPAHAGFFTRALIMALAYAQPLVRSWRRYRTRLFSYCKPIVSPVPMNDPGMDLPLNGSRAFTYWGEAGCGRTELLGLFIAYLTEHRWGTTIDSGWSDWDVEIHYHPWTLVQVATTEENHGSGRHLFRVRYRLRLTELAKLTTILGLACTAIASEFHLALAGAGLGLVAALLVGVWWRGARLASLAVKGFDKLALDQGLLRCDTTPAAKRTGKGFPACERPSLGE